jgi:Na+-driven multidrug efflux pump
MSISTQRFLSVAIGENNLSRLNEIYNASIVLHLAIGLIVVVGFEICGLFLFEGFLNIEPDRIGPAKIIYQFLVVSTFFTILSVPYGAILNAKENMLAFSIIGILEALLKLFLALYLGVCHFDRLVVYGLGMALLAIIIILINRIYVKYKYREFSFSPSVYLKKQTFYEMLGFAGWNTLGSVAMIGRNQGIAIILNLFYGTVVNAAYGIANQINSVLNYFSTTFQRALNPQLMQSEGMKDRGRLIRISLVSSKFSVLVLSFFAIPLIIEMSYVLELWLKDVPAYTLRLSQLILVLSIVFQYSMGLMSSIQAVGKIRNYFLIISFLILLNLPISYYLLKNGFPPYSCIISFICIELVSFFVRLYMATRLTGLQAKDFFSQVIAPTILVIVSSLVPALSLHFLLRESFERLVFVCVSYAIVFLVTAWRFAINDSQRQYVMNNVIKVKKYLPLNK